nr:MAG TPA: hypothetical protein [Caudoviricetes sp.]
MFCRSNRWRFQRLRCRRMAYVWLSVWPLEVSLMPRWVRAVRCMCRGCRLPDTPGWLIFFHCEPRA